MCESIKNTPSGSSRKLTGNIFHRKPKQKLSNIFSVKESKYSARGNSFSNDSNSSSSSVIGSATSISLTSSDLSKDLDEKTPEYQQF